ncbi:WXG100 family type VII secretion target [Nocardia sp. NPDC020380]|uniref:WXG100 family type VII secretion target n=1 Tax=Nocardia sp. NPDC020380 TaxID=3364309 RepID=UPI00378AEF2E
MVDASAALESAIEETVTKIEQDVDNLHVSWAGAAATAHREAHEARVRAVGEMRAALTELQTKLDNAQQAYGKVGPTNVEMWP